MADRTEGLADLLVRCLLRGVVALVSCLAVVAVGSRLTAEETRFVENVPTPRVAQPTPASAALLARHHCWSGPAPDGAFPGHVILTVRPGEGPQLRGPRWVARALEQIFDGVDHGIETVHGFCP